MGMKHWSQPWNGCEVWYESKESMRKHVTRSELLEHFKRHEAKKWLMRGAKEQDAQTMGSCLAMFSERDINETLVDLVMGRLQRNERGRLE